MNERIKQLYEQAMEQHVSNNMAWEELNPEKFAELIVKECADTVLGFHNQFGDSAHAEIREHFGVER